VRERTNEVRVERDVKVTMSDGTPLLADVYHPVGVDDAPTILERTPYGRSNFSSAAGPEFAARGYRYVLQACRGTDGSGGTHSYFAEGGDGRHTADWIASQKWFNGSMGTFGASYMGFTQWALAATKPPYLKAMAVALSTSVRAYSWYPGGSLALEVIVPWDVGATQFNKQPNAGPATDLSPEGIEQRMSELKAGFDHLPLGEVIHRLTGVELQLYRDQLEHSAADHFWDPVSFRPFLAEWTVPTLLVDGWYDYPLPGVLEDYAVLRASPAPVHLRIGAGGHLGGGGEGGMTDAPLDWFDTWLLGREGLLGPTAVKVHVQGQGGRWRNLADWPPASELTRWYLHPGGRIAPVAPAAPSEPDRYRYNPADPTPSMGGIGLLTGGMADNRPLEARSDVLVYTSDELDEPLELIGPVVAQLQVSSSLDHTDFFVRVCDVSPDGRSDNVCDGLQRFDPTSIHRTPDGTFTATVPVWPIGHTFAAGHRLRVQVSSGAHPVYARNLGTGEPPHTATNLRAADQAVHHEPGRQSWVSLPHFLCCNPAHFDAVRLTVDGRRLPSS
jgi:putative CocE/NonD family hydrolase